MCASLYVSVIIFYEFFNPHDDALFSLASHRPVRFFNMPCDAFQHI